jgi:hypothetical protein
LYLLTGGVFAIGWIVDLFTLGNQVDTYNLLHSANMNSGAFTNQNQNVAVNVPDSTDAAQKKTNAQNEVE